MTHWRKYKSRNGCRPNRFEGGVSLVLHGVPGDKLEQTTGYPRLDPILAGKCGSFDNPEKIMCWFPFSVLGVEQSQSKHFDFVVFFFSTRIIGDINE